MNQNVLQTIRQLRRIGTGRRIVFASAWLPAYALIAAGISRAFDLQMEYLPFLIGGAIWGVLWYLLSVPILRWRNRQWSRVFNAEGGLVCSCDGSGCGYEKSKIGIIVVCTQEGRLMRAVKKI